MQISKKQLLGLGGLAIVVGMTAVAYNLPTNATSVSGNVSVGVSVYSNHFETKIESPLDGDIYTKNNISFKEIHSKAANVKYYLIHVGENGEEDTVYELTDYEVNGEDVDGSTVFELDLLDYGGFGTYKFRSVITSRDGRTGEDSVMFKYVAIDTPDDKVPVDDGAIEIEVCYAAGVKVLGIEIYDKDGKRVAVANDYIVKNPTTGGCETIRVIVDDLDLNSGDYTVVITAYDDYDKTRAGGYVTVKFTYTAPDAPNVPDTGSLISALNISKSDFLITGLIGFTLISVIALFVIKRANRKE